jgi:hypothetical protein
MFVPRYSEQQARDAIAVSSSYAEALRRLDLCATGGNGQTLQNWAKRWDISTANFDPHAANAASGRLRRRPLQDLLVPGSSYDRRSLRQRLWAAGLKTRACELCGQGEVWRGRPIGLILDHINGVRDDNRLENLQIVCPNCAATLDTHCGRKNRRDVVRTCERCGEQFRPNRPEQRFCSSACGTRYPRKGKPNPKLRRVARPPYEQLMTEIDAASYLAVGRKYGVLDNAVRKWVLQYEREAGVAVSAAAAPARAAGAASRPVPTSRAP